ncbi:hypothetical protein [Herbidospora sp. RD11066]
MLAAALVGAILGGFLVALVGHPWRDDRPAFRVEMNEPMRGMPRGCERTDMGFRCEFPR